MRSSALVALLVLVLARLALGVQYQTAGSVVPFLVHEFAIDFAAAGALVGLYWLPGLAIALPSGFIGRRFGERRVVLAGLLLLAAGSLLSGMASGHSMFATGRLVSGAGAALLFALLMKMVSDWVEGPHLFVGMSVLIVGWPVGIAAARATLGPLAMAVGSWRAALFAGAAFVAVAAATFALLYPRDRVVAPGADASTGPNKVALSAREVWLVSVAGMAWMFINGAYLVLVTFGPILLAERAGSDATSNADLSVSLMSWIFLIALPLGGLAAARVSSPGLMAACSLAVSGAAVAAIPFVGIAHADIALLVHGFTYAFAAPAVSTQPVRALRAETRAPGLGIYYLWYYTGCTTLPVAAGWLKDLYGPVAPVASAVVMLAATICLMGLFAHEHRRLAFRSG